MWKALEFSLLLVVVFVQFQVVLAELAKLVDMALEQSVEQQSFDLNAKPLDSLDVDEKPPLIVKLAYAQLSTTFLWTTH